MSTLEGIVTAVIVVLSFAGVALVILVRSADRRSDPDPIDQDPRYDDPAGR